MSAYRVDLYHLPYKLHVDMYHVHWYTGKIELVCTAPEEYYDKIKGAVIHHWASGPHMEGECQTPTKLHASLVW